MVLERIRPSAGDESGHDRGAAIVEFVLVSVLLVLLLFGVLQVAVYFYVRNIVAASAADGARYAASATVGYEDGGRRAREVLSESLAGRVTRTVSCEGTPDRDPSTGLALAAVHCQGRLRSGFLPIGALLHIDVRSRALEEGQP